MNDFKPRVALIMRSDDVIEKFNLNYSYLTTIKQKRPNFCRCNKFVSLHIGKPSF